MDRQIVIAAVLAAQAGKADELARLMRDTQQLGATEPGCISYRFTRDLDDPATFHVLEIWASEQAIRAHLAAAAYTAFAGRLPAVGHVIESLWLTGGLQLFSLSPEAETSA